MSEEGKTVIFIYLAPARCQGADGYLKYVVFCHYHKGPVKQGFVEPFLQIRKLRLRVSTGDEGVFPTSDSEQEAELGFSQVRWTPELLFKPWEENRGQDIFCF